MVNEQIKMTGALDIVVRGEDGQIKQQTHVPNIVTTVGKNFIASRMIGTSNTAMGYMAIGDTSVAAAVSDTALGHELARVSLDNLGGTINAGANNVVVYTGSFPAGTGTGAVTEAGIFNASSNGIMLCRTVFSVVNKAAGDSVAITWSVTVN